MASRRFYAAAAATAGLAAGALALLPAAGQAATTTPGSLVVWGSATATYAAPPSTTGFTDTASGTPTVLFAIDSAGGLNRLVGSSAGLTPPDFAGQPVKVIKSNGTDAGGYAAALIGDGTLRTWGARGPVGYNVPLSSWGVPAGVTPVDVAFMSAAVLVLFSNGQVGEMSGFGPELLTTDGASDSPPLTGAVSIAGTPSSAAFVVLGDGTVESVDSAGNVTPQFAGGASDPIVQVSPAGAAFAITRDGVVMKRASATDPYVVDSSFPTEKADGKVVQITQVTLGGAYPAARTDHGDVVVWDSSGGTLPETGALPDGIQGKVLDLSGGGTTLQAIVADQPLVTPVALAEKPTIAGTAQVGSTLTGTAATFTGTPDSVTSVWKDITSDTELGSATTLALPASSLGHEVVYETTATKAGQESIVSASDPLTVTAAPEAPASTVTVTAPSTRYGHAGSATVKVTSTGAVSGSVKVTVDGKAAGTVALAAGSAKITLPASLAAGRHSIGAAYAGNNTSKASTGSASLVVAKATSTTKVALPKKAKKGKKVKVTVTVATSGGTAAGRVSVTIGKAKGTGTIVRGKATVTVKLAKKAGKQKVTVSYPGNANIGGSSAKATLKVK